VQALRPLPHVAEVAVLVTDLLAGSWVHEAVTTPQQAISFRAIVPHFASVVGALERFAVAVEREVNGVGDNPVVLLDSHEMASSSHFHTIDVALHGDGLSLSLYHWAEACVQRMQRTINHRHADVPALLAVGGEAATGLNPLQKTIGDLRGRMRHLANPASLDALVVSDQVEDLASQLPLVVRKLEQQVEVLGRLATLEAMVGLQCHAVRSTHQRGRASTSIESFFAEIPMPMADDTPIGSLLEQMHLRLHELVDEAASEMAALWPGNPL
jgi:histidine ammonia-lyase